MFRLTFTDNSECMNKHYIFNTFSEAEDFINAEWDRLSADFLPDIQLEEESNEMWSNYREYDEPNGCAYAVLTHHLDGYPTYEWSLYSDRKPRMTLGQLLNDVRIYSPIVLVDGEVGYPETMIMEHPDVLNRPVVGIMASMLGNEPSIDITLDWEHPEIMF